MCRSVRAASKDLDVSKLRTRSRFSMQNQIDNVPVWHRLLYAHSEYFNAYGRPSQYCACLQASIELLYNCCPLHRPNLSNQTYRTDACSALEDFAYPQFLAHGTSTVQLVKASISSKTTSSFSTAMLPISLF